VESMIEAVPQSILQMVGLVLTDSISGVSLFSICISIISVASKGYVVHRQFLHPFLLLIVHCHSFVVVFVIDDIDVIFDSSSNVLIYIRMFCC
jgi:hypothetical protein